MHEEFIFMFVAAVVPFAVVLACLTNKLLLRILSLQFIFILLLKFQSCCCQIGTLSTPFISAMNVAPVVVSELLHCVCLS